MIYKSDLVWKVVVPAENLKKKGDVPASLVATLFLKQLAASRASVHGYFFTVKQLESIGRGHHNFGYKNVVFPISCRCRIFLPAVGEVYTGTVWCATRCGVFIRCGPMKRVFLPKKFMPGYHYVSGEDLVYVGKDGSKIEAGVMLRFVLSAVKWLGKRWRDFKIVARLDRKGLGPIR